MLWERETGGRVEAAARAEGGGSLIPRPSQRWPAPSLLPASTPPTSTMAASLSARTALGGVQLQQKARAGPARLNTQIVAAVKKVNSYDDQWTKGKAAGAGRGVAAAAAAASRRWRHAADLRLSSA